MCVFRPSLPLSTTPPSIPKCTYINRVVQFRAGSNAEKEAKYVFCVPTTTTTTTDPRRFRTELGGPRAQNGRFDDDDGL